MKRMMTSRLFRKLCILAPISLAAVAHAGDGYTIDLGDQGVAGKDFTRTVTGCFLQVGVTDLVFLDDDTGIVCYEPSVFTKVVSQPGYITDLAVRAGADDVDRLYGIVNGRIARLDFVSEEDDWNIVFLANMGSSIARLISADVDGDGVDDLVTLGGDGVTLRAYVFSTENSDANAYYSGITLSGPAKDFVALNWDGSSANGDEFGVLIGGSVWILDGGGNQMAQFTTLPDSGHLTSYSNGYSSKEGLAWISSFAGAFHWLVWASVSDSPESFLLDSVGIGGVVAGDFDGVAGDDLVLTPKAGSQGRVYLQDPSGGGAAFSSASYELFKLTGLQGGPERRAAAALADFDGDGDLDIFQPDIATVELDISFNELVDEVELLPTMGSGMGELSISGFIESGASSGHDKQVFFELTAPDSARFLSAGLDVPEEVHVTVYEQVGSSDTFARHTAGTLSQGFSSNGATAFDFDTPEWSSGDGRIYYLHIRCAKRTPSGEYLYYPGTVEAITMTQSIVDDWELALGYEPSAITINSHNSGGSSHSVGGSGGQDLEPTPDTTTATAAIAVGSRPVDGTGRVPIPISTPW